jgi:uncharacterized protein (TIGR03435 family)
MKMNSGSRHHNTRLAKRTLFPLLLLAGLLGSCNSGDDTERASQTNAARPQNESTTQVESATTATEKPVEAEVPRSRVILKPAVGRENFFERHPFTARTVFRAAPIERLIRFAYDVHPRDIVLEVPLDRKTNYDALIEPLDRKQKTVRKLLRERLEEEFNIEGTFEDRSVPVLFLERTSNGIELPTSTSPYKRVIGGLGRFEGRRASMTDIARFMRTLSEKPILDQTGLEGEYDIVIEWDGSAGREAFLEAFSRSGLELNPGIASVPHLLIRRPKPTATNGPPETKPQSPDGQAEQG